MTGKTLEERIVNPVNYKQGSNIIKLQKQKNKQEKAVKDFMRVLFKTGRIGKT